ncbi:hypothetical protein WMF38_57345 [Sorangium sp. So ce118]
MSTTQPATETNVVVLMKGNKRASIRVTRQGDHITSEVCMSVAWRKLGGLQAAFNEQGRLEARGYKVVAAS